MLRQGPSLLTCSVTEFKSVVSKAIQTAAETWSVFPQTIQAKLTVKCPEKLTLNDFVTKLYGFQQSLHKEDLLRDPSLLRQHDFWCSVFSNCSDAEQEFAIAVIGELWKRYMLPG